MSRFAILVVALQVLGYALVTIAAFAIDARFGVAVLGIALLVEGRDLTREAIQ